MAARTPGKGSTDDALRDAPRVRGAGAQTVYDRLKQSIVELTLAPGAPLDEVSLSEQFAMSR
ncbi:MAG: GntR family transcriptional regulator, partial [Hyphomicrobiales bacterium]